MKNKMYRVYFENHEFNSTWIVSAVNADAAIKEVVDKIKQHCNTFKKEKRNHWYNEIITRKQLDCLEAHEIQTRGAVIYEFVEPKRY